VLLEVVMSTPKVFDLSRFAFQPKRVGIEAVTG
jgi:hypothetical protein